MCSKVVLCDCCGVLGAGERTARPRDTEPGKTAPHLSRRRRRHQRRRDLSIKDGSCSVGTTEEETDGRRKEWRKNGENEAWMDRKKNSLMNAG